MENNQYQSQQEQPQRISLRRVLYVKFLRWVDKTSTQVIVKKLWQLLSVITVAWIIIAPNFALGYLTDALRWNNYRMPILFVVLVLAFNMKRIYTMSIRSVRRKNNQHMYQGIPVGELASFLQSQQSFKRDEAMRTFALSQGQYAKIASELKLHGILHHGENNAHVLRAITTENLVRQLRDNFPMVWSEEHQVWAERNGTFERWAMAHDFKTRRLEEETERKERKLERLQKRIDATTPLLEHTFA